MDFCLHLVKLLLGTVLQVLQEEDEAADARLALRHLVVKTAPSERAQK